MLTERRILLVLGLALTATMSADAACFTIRLKPNANTQVISARNFLGSAAGGEICVKIDGMEIKITAAEGDKVGVLAKRLLDKIKAHKPGAVAADAVITVNIISPAFKVTATTVEPCDSTETDIKLHVGSGAPQSNDWQSVILYPGRTLFGFGNPPKLPVTSWNETEKIIEVQEGGETVKKLKVTMTFTNDTDEDVCVRPWIMVNWFKKDGTEARTRSLFDFPPFGPSDFGEKNVTVPKKTGNTPGTAMEMWTWPAAGDVSDQDEFALDRKFLAYIDWFECGPNGTRGPIIQYSTWVKDPPVQNAGTTQCYSIFPTNPIFNETPTNVYLQVWPDTLPPGVVVQTFPSELLIYTLDTNELAEGTICVTIDEQVPASETPFVVVVNQYDALDDSLIMSDFTEISFGPPIPAVTEWGLIVMVLLALTAGTIVFSRWRRPEAA